MDSELSFLTISLHGVSQETYEAYQPGKVFEETLRKINALISLKRAKRKVKPRIDLAFAITKKNQREVRKMQRLVKTLGVDQDLYTASINLRFYLHDTTKAIKLVREWAQNGKIDWNDISALDKERINELYGEILNERVPIFENLEFFSVLIE